MDGRCHSDMRGSASTTWNTMNTMTTIVEDNPDPKVMEEATMAPGRLETPLPPRVIPMGNTKITLRDANQAMETLKSNNMRVEPGRRQAS